MTIQRALKDAEMADDKISHKGKYLVVEFLADHRMSWQHDPSFERPTLPKGTRGIVEGHNTKDSTYLVFLDKHWDPSSTWNITLVVVPVAAVKPIGRIDHK